jgi:hypothetical protein
LTVAERLIITNGDSATARLRDAGIDAELLPWRDILHDGPVPGGLELAELSRIRSQYLAGEFDLPSAQVGGGFRDRDATVRNHARHQRIELWFEHDLVDQLQLIQLLDFFGDEERTERISLVQADDYLGLQSADALRALEGARRAVTLEQFGVASQAWAAFTAETPETLGVLAFTEEPALPYLAPALRRLLQELPATGSGLALTEQRILAALADGPCKIGQMFEITQAQEAARFLGDSPFFQRIDGLAFAATPLIEGVPFASKRIGGGRERAEYWTYAGSTISLTEAGRAALADRFDHARENNIDRWLGGTHITPEAPWRRQPDGRPILMA